MEFKNPIIPPNQYFIGQNDQWNYPAICIFAAIGFFLDKDTYFKDLRVLSPATLFQSAGQENRYFNWHYSPRDITLKKATEEFTALFESIIEEQVGDRKVILPLSGGIDSRTLAAALSYLAKPVNSYSYRFTGGHDESWYGKQIAESCSFPFKEWEVPRGYLWNCINKLAEINGCYSEFTNPRQMAFLDNYKAMGDVFSLGHWGDVLFDDMGVPDDLSFDAQLDVVLKKILKRGGIELADAMWQIWGLPGSFEPYLRERVSSLLSTIDIPHSANARIRAFKSMYWAPRWTSVNLSVFESVRPIALPYYDDRMCQFICTIPEKHLSGRQIQIEYLKIRAPKLASIVWQDHRPFNLFNYHWDKTPWNVPFRAFDKAKREWREFRGKNLIQRNWELQFLGSENEKQLRLFLLGSPSFREFLPESLVSNVINQFNQREPLLSAHAVSTLLTLSMKLRKS